MKKRVSEALNRRTDDTIVKRKRTKKTNNDIQNTIQLSNKNPANKQWGELGCFRTYVVIVISVLALSAVDQMVQFLNGSKQSLSN